MFYEVWVCEHCEEVVPVSRGNPFHDLHGYSCQDRHDAAVNSLNEGFATAFADAGIWRGEAEELIADTWGTIFLTIFLTEELEDEQTWDCFVRLMMMGFFRSLGEARLLEILGGDLESGQWYVEASTPRDYLHFLRSSLGGEELVPILRWVEEQLAT